MKKISTPLEAELSQRRYQDESQHGDNRSPFQHDRDRIIHSTAFRRLQYKTQVYVIHEGDFYRTRLTHSLEVAQIARGIAAHLAEPFGVEPDLAESIALAHDVGHPPFGHIGGEELNHLLKQYEIPFDHNVQSYRIVTELEERYTEFKGLNLTYGTLEGILRHCTFFDKESDIVNNIPEELKEEAASFWTHQQPIIEAQIVNVSDSIAYATHDLEDAMEVGLLEWNEFKTLSEKYGLKSVLDIIGDVEEAMAKYKQLNGDVSKAIFEKVRNRTLSRLFINKLILETVSQSGSNLNGYTCASEELLEKVRDSQSITIALPPSLESDLKNLLENILIKRVYREPRVMIMMQKAKNILETVFEACMDEPGLLPKRTQFRLKPYYELGDKKSSDEGKHMLGKVVGDYISGMTDKYAMDMYQLLTQAYEKAL